MDSYRDLFRVILELSNDKASSTTGIRIYYLDGYHVTLDVKSETTLKELCAQVMHGMKMGLYEVENEFGPAHEQRLLDGDMTVGELATRWKSKDWPNAKLIAPIYLKEWSSTSPSRQVHFDSVRRQSPGRSPSTTRTSRSPSPASFLNNLDETHSSPPRSANSRVTTPDSSNGRIINGIGASPGSGGKSSRRRSPGTTARAHTNALLNTLFNNTHDEYVPRRRAETPTGLPVVVPVDTTSAVDTASTSTVDAPVAQLLASSPAHRQSPASSPASAARRDAAPSRRQSSSHTAVSPRTSSAVRTVNATCTVTPNRTHQGAGNGSVSSISSTNSSLPNRPESAIIIVRRSKSTQSPPASPMGRQLTYPREVIVSRSTTPNLLSRSATPTNTMSTQTPVASPERNFASPREIAVTEAAQEPVAVFADANAVTLSQEFEAEMAPVYSSPEKIRPRTTYVQIAGLSEGMSSRANFENVEETPTQSLSHSLSQSQSSSNIFDLNNSPPLTVPASVPMAHTQLIKPEEVKESESPTTTGSANSGTSTPPGSVNGLSPYPSWRGSSSALASAPDLTVTTPPQAAPIHALYSRLFGAPVENDFTLPLSPVATSQYHSPPKPKNILISSLEGVDALPRYSRSSSPAGSVGSNGDSSVVSAGGTRRPRKSSQVFVRPPFDTSYNGPTLSQLLSSSGDGTTGPSVTVSEVGDDLQTNTDDTISLQATPTTPAPQAEQLPPRYVTPVSVRKTPAQARPSNTHSASRLPRKVSSGAMSESSESSALSNGSHGVRRATPGATPGSATHRKSSANNTPQSTVDKLKRGANGKAGAAFGHCITPTSAQIRESFDAKNALSAEQVAAGHYTQSYAQLHGGYVPHRRPSGNKTGDHNPTSSDTTHVVPSGRNTPGADTEAAKRRAARDNRSDSPHSVHSGVSGGGSRPTSALRGRHTSSSTWRP